MLADFLRQGYWQAEAHQRRQDGTDVYVLASTSFFRDAHGTPIGVVSVNRDITERRLTEQVFQQYAAEVEDLYNHAPVGYHSLNAEGLIVQINDTELDWLGYSRNEVVGKLRFMDFVTPDSRKVFQNNFPIFIERGWVKDLEFDLVRKDGSIFSVLLNATAIKDEHGQFLKSRSTIFDITERKRVETALRESEEKFRLLVEVAPVAIIISDNAGQIILVNNQAEVLFGYNHTELLGQPVETLLPEHLRAAHVHHRASYMAEPRVRQMGIGLELFARRKEGSVFPVEIQLSYIETQAGLMVMSFVLDITERKRAAQALREQRDFLQLIIDNVPDLIMVKDRSGRFQMVNDAAAQVYGVTPAAMIGLADADVNTNETEIAFFLQKDRETLAAGRVSFIPEELILNRYYQTSKIPLMNSAGEYERLLVVASDITERRIAEQALQQALEKERELGELKSRFVSMASHEFRTPLATILALTETLTAYRQKMTDDQIGGRLVKIQIQIEHLKDIMDDVLQLARMQARRVEFNPAVMDLDALCRSVLDEFQSRPDITHRLVYTCDEALRNVRLDKKLMRQIINNLVSNAIKYSSADTTVTIALNYTGEALVLRVSDEGIGIPEADLKHLFEPFHRAANVGTISGTGLGLTIIKESVELHGGIITVESQVSVGTTFTVRIPLTVEEGAV